MPIALNITRPKLETTVSVGVTIAPGTVSENSNNIELAVRLQDLQPDSSPSFACDYTTGSDQITFVNNTGNPISKYIRVGDIISGDNTAFPADEVVTAISVTGNNVTLTASANALGNGSDTPLTFSPAPIDSTVYILQLTHTTSGNSLVIVPKLHAFDGTTVRDANINGIDDSLLSDATTIKTFGSHTINIDSFLQNARVSRTNS